MSRRSVCRRLGAVFEPGDIGYPVALPARKAGCFRFYLEVGGDAPLQRRLDVLERVDIDHGVEPAEKRGQAKNGVKSCLLPHESV